MKRACRIVTANRPDRVSVLSQVTGHGKCRLTYTAISEARVGYGLFALRCRLGEGFQLLQGICAVRCMKSESARGATKATKGLLEGVCCGLPFPPNLDSDPDTLVDIFCPPLIIHT